MIDINNKIHEELIREAAKTNFWAFCCFYDFEFFAKKRRFLKPVAEAMQLVIDEYIEGRAIKISVSMPPRAGKSYITSLFAAYWLCRFPELSVMRNTCTATLYDKLSYDTRAIIRSEKLKEVFPEVELSRDKQNVSGWNLTTAKQVSYFGAGVGGSIIGFGANLAITDDLYVNMRAAMSDAVKTMTRSWKQSAHDSRKEKNCPEIYIGTRWTTDDVIGEIIDSGQLTKCVIIPALDENDKSFCEDVKTTEEYIHIRETIEPSIWGAEYMQKPANIEGLLLPKSSLKFDDLSKLDSTQCSYRVAVGDPADKGGDKYSMPFIWMTATQNGVICYVKSVVHNGFGIMENTDKIAERVKRLMIGEIVIESNGVGLAAINEMKRAGFGTTTSGIKLVPLAATEQKEVRIQANYEFIQDNFVFDINYADDPEYRSFINDLTSYVAGEDNKHKKDAIDVLSTASDIIKYKFARLIYR